MLFMSKNLPVFLDKPNQFIDSWFEYMTSAIKSQETYNLPGWGKLLEKKKYFAQTRTVIEQTEPFSESISTTRGRRIHDF